MWSRTIPVSTAWWAPHCDGNQCLLHHAPGRRNHPLKAFPIVTQCDLMVGIVANTSASDFRAAVLRERLYSIWSVLRDNMGSSIQRFQIKNICPGPTTLCATCGAPRRPVRPGRPPLAQDCLTNAHTRTPKVEIGKSAGGCPGRSFKRLLRSTHSRNVASLLLRNTANILSRLAGLIWGNLRRAWKREEGLGTHHPVRGVIDFPQAVRPIPHEALQALSMCRISSSRSQTTDIRTRVDREYERPGSRLVWGFGPYFSSACQVL